MKLSFPEHHLFQLLKRYENQHLPLDLFLSHYFRAHRALGSRDRQLIAGAAYGMLRWLSLLDHLVGQLPSWEKRYAVYRSFQPANYLSVNSIPLHKRVSFPKDLFSLLVKGYGEEKAIYLAQVCNTEAPLTIRANPLKTTREALLHRWSSEYHVAATSRSPLGLQFNQRYPLTAWQEFRDGLFEIQDEASQLVGLLVEAKEDQQVLDFCSGSGGKTLAFAHRLGGKGQIYLHDNRQAALLQARKRLKRAGIQNAQFLIENHPHLKHLRNKMDWVLVDAPCSGTGTLRRNPDQKWKFSLPMLQTLKQEQKAIFARALEYVKPGGKIIYATCSLLPDENEQQVEEFMACHSLKLSVPPFVTLPSYGGMDGFYAATFSREQK